MLPQIPKGLRQTGWIIAGSGRVLQNGLTLARRFLRLFGWLVFLALILGSSAVPPGSQISQVRAFTRAIEFDFVGWTLNAFAVKISQFALGTSNYLAETQRKQAVLEYLRLVTEIQDQEAQLLDIYADPNIPDPEISSTPIREKLAELYQRRANLAPLAESTLQSQMSHTLAELGLTLGGQPIPPVLYHSTPLPLALIVSPRDEIRQIVDVSLLPDLTIAQRAALEDQVDQALNVSSLVVPIGGIGFYPTMVYQTNSLTVLAEVVAHEWVHNFLTLRPLGINYLTSPELRTMNETAASIAGKEISLALIKRYYPEFAPPPPPLASEESQPTEEAPPTPVFSYNAEMRITRVTVDELLAAGKIEEAEAYMEERRRFFWENGYRIRKLNQAFFAFYGAYADQPGGAAGEDPVGAAVRELRAQSPTLAVFLNRISWMSSFDQLNQAVLENRNNDPLSTR